MPLQNLTNNLVTRVVPLDLGKAFSVQPGGLAFTGTGFVGATALVPGANVASSQMLDIGVGRLDAILELDVFALKVSAGNETYQAALIGSNDPTFGAGNCELLAFHDFAAGAAARVAQPYTGASPVMPQPGLSSRRHHLLFSNERGGYLLRYLQLLLILGGTAPSITLNSWVADRESLVG